MYQKVILDNGLRIILAPKEGTSASSMIVLIRNGFEYESKELTGISHFLEHMFHKGTEKRPIAKEISKAIEGKGGIFNAFTSEEVVSYIVKITASRLEVAIDVLSDILLNSQLKSEDIEKEKKVIIEEINMENDDAVEMLESLWISLLYKNTPAAGPILGTKTSIRGITRKKLQDYIKTYYRSQNIVVSIAGNIDVQKIPAVVEKCFSGIERGEAPDKPRIRVIQRRPEVLLHYKETEQTHFLFGARIPNYTLFSPQRYAIKLLNVILGGNMSSRLFVKVREEMGAAYDVSSDMDLMTDRGHMFVSAGTDNQKAEEAIKAILEEYKDVAGRGISPEELEDAKEYKIGTLTLGFEDSLFWASFFGEQELFLNRFLTPEEEMENYKKLKIEDVNEVAREIFRPENLNLAIIGLHKNKEKFKRILEEF